MFDLSLDPGETVAADISRFGISTLAAAAAAALSALAGYAPLRFLAAAALAGGIGWAAYGALTLLHIGPVVATGLAAVLIGLASEIIDRRTTTDRHVIVLSGIIPLLPGLTAYRGFYQLASAQDVWTAGHHHPRARHRPRPRRRSDLRPVHRPPRPRPRQETG